jgi:hypothetical protein
MKNEENEEAGSSVEEKVILECSQFPFARPSNKFENAKVLIHGVLKQSSGIWVCDAKWR